MGYLARRSESTPGYLPSGLVPALAIRTPRAGDALPAWLERTVFRFAIGDLYPESAVKLVVAGMIAFLLKLLLAGSTMGSNDARTWKYDLTTLHTAGFAELYRWGVQYDVDYDSPSGRLSQRQAFIHPPAVLHALRILGNRF